MKNEINSRRLFSILTAISILVLIVGSVNKMQHYPYGLEIQLVGLITSVTFGAALFFKSSLKNASFLYIFAAVAIIGGLVFKRFHFPGASILLIAGCLSATAWGFISLLPKKK